MSADWVLEATGKDFAAAFRGRYSTAAGAARALKRYGAGDLPATATMMLGPPLRSPMLAQRGDVVAITGADGRMALGICIGAQIAAPDPVRGLTMLPLTAAALAWRV